MIVHPKITILSSFTHILVTPTLYDIIYSVEHKIRYFLCFYVHLIEASGNQNVILFNDNKPVFYIIVIYNILSSFFSVSKYLNYLLSAK